MTERGLPPYQDFRISFFITCLALAACSRTSLAAIKKLNIRNPRMAFKISLTAGGLEWIFFYSAVKYQTLAAPEAGLGDFIRARIGNWFPAGVTLGASLLEAAIYFEPVGS